MKRFKPLDIFRGMTICLMIIVNTPGSWSYVFAPFLHAPWHGFTPTDLVFPSFLFAVGNAFAFVKSRWADKAFKNVFGKIFKRTVLIFLIGYLLYWFPFVRWNDAGELYFKSVGSTRIFGVLQRIALCYFFAAIMIYHLSKKGLYIWSGILLVGYWIIMTAFGDLTLEGNFARTVDLWLIGEGHMYKGEGLPFDPEGLLSTIPAIVNVIGGYLVGIYIINGGINYEKLSKILLIGSGLMLVAYIWDLGFPINKKIWTSSYVLLTIGMDMIILAGIIYTTEFIKKPVNYRFFEIFGKNSLFIYVLSGVIAIVLLFIKVDGTSLYGYIYTNGFKWIDPYIGSFLFAFTIMMICWAVGWWLDKKKIYIKV